MFGFLKKKLKAAVDKFSSSAKKEVTEEKVEDVQEIEKAKVEEKKIIEKPKVKSVPKKVEEDVTKVEKVPEKVEPEEHVDVKKLEPEKSLFEKVKEAVTGKSPDEPVYEKTKKEILEKVVPKEVEPVKEKPVPKKIVEETPKVEKPVEAPKKVEPTPKPSVEEKPKKPSFLGKLKETFTKKTLSEEKFDELFWELEMAMLENNVAVEVIEKIKADLKDELTTGKVNRMGIEDMIMARLRSSIEELFDVESFDLLERIKQADKPFKICMIGVNGSGKTTHLAKLVHMFKKNNLTCVVAASDTFRAAAIDQLKEHTDKLGVKLISQGYNADPAAVAFDAIKHAEANKIDVVLIDTAGRLHSNTNLMAELEKVVRVSKPDLKIFVGESITGNDCVEQAKVFDSLVGIDAIILSKADVDDKGGAAISVSYITGKPILYFGTGQTYEDIEAFDREKVIAAVGL